MAKEAIDQIPGDREVSEAQAQDQVTMVLMDLQMMRLSHSIMVSFKKLRREWIQL